MSRNWIVLLLLCLTITTASWAQQDTQPDQPPGQAGGTVSTTDTSRQQPAAANEQSGAQRSPSGFFEILKASGIIGLLILLLSVAAVALVIEHAMSLRRRVLLPEGLADELARLLASGNLPAAEQRCQAQPSALSFVVSLGLKEIANGWNAVEKAVEDALAEQSARLLRKIEYLSVISNIAPMLGLLGTVVGMILAFRRVAETQGAARAADLAQGIYLALVTTVEGLIVAIPTYAAHAYFRNRIDELVAEVAFAAQHCLSPLKRRRIAGRSTAASHRQKPPA